VRHTGSRGATVYRSENTGLRVERSNPLRQRTLQRLFSATERVV